MVDFCEKCGALLYPEKKKAKTILKCRNCGATQDTDKSEAYRVVSEIQQSIKDETIVINGNEKALNAMPTTANVCPKCNHPTAYYWQVQTRSADEAMTTFLRCQKCGHTSRDYG